MQCHPKGSQRVGHIMTRRKVRLRVLVWEAERLIKTAIVTESRRNTPVILL